MSNNMDNAISNLLTRAKNAATTATAEELVYLAKAIEAVAPGESANFLITTAEQEANSLADLGDSKKSAVTSAGTAQVSAVNSAGNSRVAEINALKASSFKTVGGESILGSGNIQSGKFLGMAYKQFKGREYTSGRISNMTLNYVKKSSTSRLIIQSYLFGESNSHDNTLRLWNSVDGYWADGSNGQSDCSLKMSNGEYYGSDTNSTPGNAMHIAVTSKMSAGTNVEFRWYVSSNTSLIGGSWSTSYEHASCWMVVTEVEE